MKLQIIKILDRGIANKERLWLKASVDTDLSHFMVMETVYTNPNAIASAKRIIFWFPKKLIKAGDSIVLFTSTGNASQTTNTDGTTTHFFYWGMQQTIWNKQADCAVLFEITSWMTTASL